MKKASAKVNSQIVQKLLMAITEGEYRDANRLPSEISLSESLGVSRNSMRDALSLLEREGFISRKHGIGTLINRHVLKVTTRIDLEREFLDIIRDAGYEPKSVYSKIEYGDATPIEMEKLCLTEGTPVVRVTKLISADGVPTILCTDIFATSIIKNHNYDETELHQPIFYFLKKYCGEDIFLDLTEIHAVHADKMVSTELQIPEGNAILHLKERGYNIFGKLILYSSEFYREGLITHTILRKKID